MNSGTLYKRLKFAGDVSNGRVGSMPLIGWRDWTRLSAVPLDQQVDGIVRGMLGGIAEPATRDAMLKTTLAPEAAGKTGDGILRLREVLAIALQSPEFQRR
jgi:hypothetical protein